jgi:hypothetical protein
MQDDRFEPPLPDAVKEYRTPPALDAAAREAMWSEIEARHFTPRPAPRGRWTPGWIGLAAALVIGVALGRFLPRRPTAPATPVAAALPSAAVAKLPVPAVYEPTTSQYLGQTTALLVALPSEVRDGHANALFISRAQNLLLTTRLLLDSPAAHNPKLRGLLDDLEVVLAQVVRLQAAPGTDDLDLINQALEQRDVLPRLRTAAADITAD